MIDMTGKVAIVTGAARGIGRAAAVALAEAGASVVVSDLQERVTGLTYATATSEDLDETVHAIESIGGRALAVRADVRRFEDLQRVVAAATDTFGRLDTVVANAGIASWPASTWQATEEQWQTMIDVTLTGTWNTCRAAIPAMLKAGQGGAILIVSSTAAIKPIPTIGHYAAAKMGLTGLAKSLALELAADSIRVNTVHPGGTSTHMTENDAAEHWQSTAPGVAGGLKLPMPITRMEPEEIGNAIRWLCSDESRYVTGTSLIVDAGATLQ
ncbi:MAG: mycofactocin-coupled SDR family oxidoreductase [Homoserinimonas sp.]